MNTSAAATGATTPEAQAYLRHIRSPWKIRLWFLKNLPSALWWGIRVKSADPRRAEVTLPFNWRTQNPFRSIYFAALAGAGELSTGILANAARLGRGDISLLVLHQQAEFLKKADSLTTFTCEEGEAAQAAVELALQTRQPQTATMWGTGRNAAGDVVARVGITWTYKVRN